MELRHLRYFVAVAEHLHFSRAAAQLHLTQPALSRQVRDLEEEIGTRLFRRHGAQTTLTAAGGRFQRRAQEILQAAERAIEEARMEGRQLRFGHYGTLWADLYAPALRAFARRHPTVILQAVELTPTELVRGLRHGELDLALLGPVDARLQREFATRRLGAVPAMLAVAADHPLAKRRAVDLTELSDEPWIGWDERSFPRRLGLLREAARAAGFTPRVVHTVDSVASLFMHVATSRAVGYVLPMSRKLPHSGVVFLKLRPPGISLEMHAAWPRATMAAAHIEELAGRMAQVTYRA